MRSTSAVALAAAAVCLSAVLLGAEARCKLSDAKWKNNLGPIGPLVTQPSSADPGRVMVEWGDILKNERCVDAFNVWMWEPGKDRDSTGKKLAVTDKSVTSAIVDVDPCVVHNFQVEIVEKEIFSTDIESSGVVSFATAAEAEVVDVGRDNFKVGYYYDRFSGVHDFSKVSVRFPASIVKNLNCLKHAQLTAEEAVSWPTTSRPAYRDDAMEWAMHQAHEEVLEMPRLPGYPFVSDSIRINRRKRSPKPVPITSTTTTTTGRPELVAPKMPLVPTGYSYPPFVGKTVEVVVDLYKPCRPHWLTLTLASYSGDAVAVVAGLEVPSIGQFEDFRPPKLSSIFEVQERVQASMETTTTAYPFIQQRQQPTGGFRREASEMYRVTGEIMQTVSGTSGDTTAFDVGLRPGSGVPGECLVEFFSAVDEYLARLEKDRAIHQVAEMKQEEHANQLRRQVIEQKSAELKEAGCSCVDPLLILNQTSGASSRSYNKYPEIFGAYGYEGIDSTGRPYYKRIDSGLPLPEEHLAHPWLVGSSVGTSSTRTRRSAETVFYLYWDAEEGAWSVGEERDGSGVYLRTKAPAATEARCPGDDSARETWQYSSTLKWKSDKTVVFECGH